MLDIIAAFQVVIVVFVLVVCIGAVSGLITDWFKEG